MKLYHKRTKNENIHILWQSLLVFVIVFVFMYAVKTYTNADASLSAIGATSLGSSAFLAFVAHDTAMARARRMIWGYIFGIGVGAVLSGLLQVVGNCDGFHCSAADLDVLFAAVAAIVTMLLMTFFSSEHPPAVGIAIGLVLRQWDMPLLLIVMITVLLIAIVKSVLRPWLLNLL